MQNVILLLAQAETEVEVEGGAIYKIQEWMSFLGPAAPWVLAIIIFLFGWFIAKLVRDLIEKLLGKTSFDEKVAKIFGAESANSEKAVAAFVYYLLLLFILIMALDLVGLETVVEPLQGMFNSFLAFIPKLIAAAAIVFVAIVLATVVKSLLKGILNGARVDDRLGTGEKKPVTNAIATAAYFFIILLLLPAALNALEMVSVSEPIQGLVDDILGYIPNLLGGVIIFAVGYLVAWIVQQVLFNLLTAAGADRLPAKLGYKGDATIGGHSFSKILSYIAMATIVVIVSAEALKQMELGFISELAEGFVPGYLDLLLAIVIFCIGVFVANIVSQFIENATWAKIARIAIMVFAGAVALQKANISNLTDDTFQTLIIAAIIAVAFAAGVGGAIAIGLGGREKAKSTLEKIGKK